VHPLSHHTLLKCRLPARSMENMKNFLKASRHMNSLDYVAGQGQQDLEKECSGCQRMKIHLGAINSTMTFELETLSQHRHLIERLQDEVFAAKLRTNAVKWRTCKDVWIRWRTTIGSPLPPTTIRKLQEICQQPQ
jgi:hypothetical protein